MAAKKVKPVKGSNAPKGNFGYITVTEAAKKLGVSRQEVWRKIKTAKIPALFFGSQYMIPGGAIPHKTPKQA